MFNASHQKEKLAGITMRRTALALLVGSLSVAFLYRLCSDGSSGKLPKITFQDFPQVKGETVRVREQTQQQGRSETVQTLSKSIRENSESIRGKKQLEPGSSESVQMLGKSPQGNSTLWQRQLQGKGEVLLEQLPRQETYLPWDRQKAAALLLHVLKQIETRAVPDVSGDYIIVENLLTSGSWRRRQRVANDVTLVTQCTSNHLHHLSDISARWGGPVSVALFTHRDDLVTAVDALLLLRLCSPSVARHVSVHLSLPAGHATPAALRPDRFLRHVADCNAALHWGSQPPASPSTEEASSPSSSSSSSSASSASPTAGGASNFDLGPGIEYPINLLRNLALRLALSTEYVFYVDVDLFFSDNLREDFIRDVTTVPDRYQNGTNIAYVVLAFEYMTPEEGFPADKAALLTVWKQHKVRQFHLETCYHCHGINKYIYWRTLTGGGKMEVAYRVRFKPGYEPYYITRRSMPLYDERFRQFGRDRQSQVCEMHFADYSFHVLNNAFLVHPGFKDYIDFDKFPTRAQEMQRNTILFFQFHDELQLKYPRRVSQGNCVHLCLNAS